MMEQNLGVVHAYLVVLLDSLMEHSQRRGGQDATHAVHMERVHPLHSLDHIASMTKADKRCTSFIK